MPDHVECAFVDAVGRELRELLLALELRSIRYYGRASYDESELATWCELAMRESREESANFAICVARSRDVLVGYAELDEARGHIGALYVDVGRAGRGIGSALLARLEALALRAGQRTLFVDASLNAVAFYRARGFQPSGTAWYAPRTGTPLVAELHQKRLVRYAERAPATITAARGRAPRRFDPESR
jgi:putative acetyltransferase